MFWRKHFETFFFVRNNKMLTIIVRKNLPYANLKIFLGFSMLSLNISRDRLVVVTRSTAFWTWNWHGLSSLSSTFTSVEYMVIAEFPDAQHHFLLSLMVMLMSCGQSFINLRDIYTLQYEGIQWTRAGVNVFCQMPISKEGFGWPSIRWKKGIPDLQKQGENPLQILRQELWLKKATQLCKLFAIITAYLMSTNISGGAIVNCRIYSFHVSYIVFLRYPPAFILWQKKHRYFQKT